MKCVQALLCAAVIAAQGCGDSGGSASEAGTGSSAAGAVSPGGSGAAAVGATGGAGGTSADTDASAGSGRVVCGGVGGFICTRSIELMGRTLGPCCDEDSGNICGAGFGNQCEGLDQPGELTDACPTEMSPLGEMLPGCCRPDGSCGVMITIGFGCVERGDVTEIGVGPFDAMSCDSDQPADAGQPVDSGTP